MPSNIKRTDIERALSLLQQYRGKLKNAEDEALRKSIEHVLKVLESKLFNALLDIAEYYDEILKDVHRSPAQVEREAAIIAKKWELNGKSALETKISINPDEMVVLNGDVDGNGPDSVCGKSRGPPDPGCLPGNPSRDDSDMNGHGASLEKDH